MLISIHRGGAPARPVMSVAGQGAQEGSLVVAGESCSPWPVGVPGSLLGEGVGEGLLQGARDESCRAGGAAVSRVEAGVVRREPEWQ